MARPVKVLCVGTEDTTLNTRIAVLQQAHFDAIGCTPERLPEVMAAETFDIILLSAGVVGLRQQNCVTNPAAPSHLLRSLHVPSRVA